MDNETRIARWDLDKTYLRTEFDTLRDLVRTAFEQPIAKRAFAGATTLLRELSRARTELHVLSGSPEQLRARLEAKLRLDGIAPASLTLKPNLANLVRLRFRAIRDQLGFKFPALVLARSQADQRDDAPVREVLFGDDSEADAFVYSLYADTVAGRVPGDSLTGILQAGRVYEDVIADVMASLRGLRHRDLVSRIFIHLEGQGPPTRFAPYGPRVVPFYNYLQPALVLHEEGWISARAVLSVAIELVSVHFMDADSLIRSAEELSRRGHLQGTAFSTLKPALDAWAGEQRLPALEALRLFVACGDRIVHAVSQGSHVPVPSAISYQDLVLAHNPRRRRH